MRRVRFLALLLWVLLCMACQTSSTEKDTLQPLRGQLTACIEGVDAKVGIAMVSPEGDTLTINNEGRYPLMSVFKFHQALAVCDALDRQQRTLEEKIHILPQDLQMDTYSPLKDRYPAGNIDLSIAELLTYTLQWSDNLACDLLFDRIVSPEQTDRFLREKTGVNNFQIRHNEAGMQEHLPHGYENWTSPYAAVQLLQHFLEGKIVDEPFFSFIYQQLVHCQTGARKLALPLKGSSAIIGHKTGGGPTNSEGRVMANNDIGFVVLPNRSPFLIAVFVKDARLSPEASDTLIATLSKTVYQYFSAK